MYGVLGRNCNSSFFHIPEKTWRRGSRIQYFKPSMIWMIKISVCSKPGNIINPPCKMGFKYNMYWRLRSGCRARTLQSWPASFGSTSENHRTMNILSENEEIGMI